MSIPVIETKSLGKSFGSVRANHDINLSVSAGELLCLFGENGAGKSTLSACLTGFYLPDRGEILFKGAKTNLKSPMDAIRLGIGLVHQHFVLVPDFTVLENIIIGSNKSFLVPHAEAEKKLNTLCAHYGIEIDPNVSVQDLSVGEQQWVELLKALYFEVDLLILDEPTATLDVENSKKLFKIIDKLKADGIGLIIITHKLDEVMQSDRVVVLRQGQIAGERRPEDTSREELTRMMVGRDLEVPVRKSRVIDTPRLVLESVSVAGAGQKQDLADISLSVHAGEIVGIAAVAGNGQNPLMEIIAGIRTPNAGRVTLDGQDITNLGVKNIMEIGLGHIPEDRYSQGLVPQFSIAENMILGNHRDEFAQSGLLNRKKMNAFADQEISDFQISTPSRETPAASLSGGNAQRIILARELRLATKVLLANQPTRGLDVGVIEYIHKKVLQKRDEGVAVLLASTELEDLLLLCDRIGVMFEGQLMGVVDVATTSVEEIGLLMAGQRQVQAA